MTCGIYQILHVSGIRYVGQSVNVKGRLRGHFRALRNGIHRNAYLQHAWNKHGSDSFVFELIEECSRELLTEREQFHMDASERLYNSAPAAGSTVGLKYSAEVRSRLNKAHIGVPLSDEHRAAISAANKGKKKGPIGQEARARMSAGQKGKKYGSWSDERRANASVAQKGIYHKPTSAETKAKQSAALKGRKLSAERCAAISAARVGIRLSDSHRAAISAACKGKKLSPEHRAKISAAQKGVPKPRHC